MALPMLCTRFVSPEFKLSDPAASPHVRLVSAYFNNSLRSRCFTHWTGALESGQGFCMGRGMFWWCNGGARAVTDADAYAAADYVADLVAALPVAPDGLPGAAEKRAWQAAIDAELMAAAWHPRRMAYWQAQDGHEEEEEDGARPAAAVTVLRLGEVLVVDGALDAADVARLAALADSVAYLGLHACPEALAVLGRALRRRAQLPGLAVCASPPLATLGHSRARAVHQDGALVGGEVSVLAYLDDAGGGGGQITFFPTLDDEDAPPPPPVTVAPRAGRLVVFGVYLSHEVAAPRGVKRLAGCEARWWRHVPATTPLPLAGQPIAMRTRSKRMHDTG